ncbi:hypothetical protein BC835DRAFT_1276765 [Cytidiella melzeri]|nr:hypothetical protein BC835DRAFT_1276765 [Cytidiella melzeri]
MLPNSRGYLHPFLNGRSYLYGVGELPRTLTELAMCKLSARIRSTDERWLNIANDNSFREYWTNDAISSTHTISTSSGRVNVSLSTKQVEYVLDELQSYASLRDLDNSCEVSCFDRIWQTSEPLPLELTNSLIEQAAALTAKPDMDLVDPYAYSIVYGRTPRLTSDNILQETSIPKAWYYAFSTRFSCLPTSFRIAAEVEPCRATALGYINGIPPHMPSMSANIESVLSRAVPLLEHVLTDLHRDNPLRHRISGSCKYLECDEPTEPERSDDEEGWTKYHKELQDRSRSRPIVQPDVPEAGYTGGLEYRRDRVSLRGRIVNIIVRMTEVRLRPDRPYQGPSPWHAEGMVNEHIVACAFTCIAAHNAKPMSIDYRMAVQAPLVHLPGDLEATMRIWGLRDGAPSHQYLGSSKLTPGRIVSYPNIYQTQLSSTALIDPRQEGSVTLLGLYLIDPDFPNIMNDDDILTTTSVPPQDRKWIHKALEDSLDIRIPMEVIDNIVDHMDWLMSEVEYEQCAMRMRREREAFWQTNDQLWFSVPFSVWKD